MRESLQKWWLAASATALISLSIACAGSQAQQTGSAAAGGRGAAAGGAAVPVSVAPVVQKDMPLEIVAVGAAEAYSTVSVHGQITGELKSVNFKQGDDVRAGQVLFTLDQRPLEAALHQADANLARDTAQFNNAKIQADRYADLAKQGLATKEQAGTTQSSAQALEATLAADQAAVENARVQLQYATISSPISGRTGSLMVNAGNLIRANDQTPLVIINQISPIYVTFSIPEAMLSDLKKYMAKGTLHVEASPPNEDENPAEGRVTFVDNTVDPTTGTIKVKGTFGNENRRLWPGQFLNVVVRLTTDPGAIVVPAVAVQAGPQGQYVYVVNEKKAVDMRPVTVARTAGDEVVIKTGLTAGETVVTDGHLRLTPGSRISVKNAGQKATS